MSDATGPDAHQDDEGDRRWGFRTRAIHAGAVPDSATGARATPIYQTTSFVFDDVEDARSLFALQKYGLVYSRLSNPTVSVLEERIASLEGAIGAMATATGNAATFLAMACLTQSGDHLVSGANLYGGTVSLLNGTMDRFGVDTTFIPSTGTIDDWAAAITDRTKALFAEVVANPGGEVADLAALADLAHAHDLPLVVDATTVTPYLCRPMEHGADIVIHSVTKFLGGHGTTLGGVVAESGRFNWSTGRFPQMTTPVPSYGNLSWWENFGEYAFMTRLRFDNQRDVGATLSPHSAFLLLQGIETLPQRMAAHVANARGLAEWLEADPRVSWVRWAGLTSHPHHDRAARYVPDGPGAVLSFGLPGGREAGVAFIEALELCSHLANIGDVRTLVIHPATTTHHRLSADELDAAGIGTDLVRVSVGLEDLDDIIYDIDRALEVAARA